MRLIRYLEINRSRKVRAFRIGRASGAGKLTWKVSCAGGPQRGGTLLVYPGYRYSKQSSHVLRQDVRSDGLVRLISLPVPAMLITCARKSCERPTIHTMDDLKELIRTHPIIDNHAHNILRPHALRSADFRSITTEAAGSALHDTLTSLAHLRAVRQLRTLYDLPEAADWPAVLGKRTELLERDSEALTRKCFSGTQTLLIDDGLDNGDNVEHYIWHNSYTRSPCKRIVRIETVAASILSAMHQQGRLPVGVAIADEEACSLAWATFISEFEAAVAAALEDSEVVGFKSVICYRTGLAVVLGRDIEVSAEGLHSFRKHFLPEAVARQFRVETKGMKDTLVISTCKLIAAANTQRGRTKPLQFHTGLGDYDIDLITANPACLQNLIKAFPTVPFVLLNSAYPYTREAGYLATVYSNAYLDIGEVFPMVSRHGQEAILRQALELTPWSKILWSTDGHHFPETYWLANVQGRAAMENVLCEFVERKELTIPQACQAVKDILFENSNRLYALDLKVDAESKMDVDRSTQAVSV